ncbi:homoserine O-succinyltransferase [Marinobacterium nitratireducens]|uniref:Homoserine O-succinyltransferase n=1 Tax=Marinobacterium nitratireducens TaxID=518897 RepID=A0A917ZPQ3_9GAMM|nr:homoserine O-succinyltransferase [Marinobacterium nitratireducens]GGO86766.1 homoserine O-succinyltransferase [Marinobacterium nitratireducens]
MPIKIPDQLPAADLLRSENIFVMSESRAMHQDVRPLKVVILNLMPKKIETENQLVRLLSNTPLQVDIELLRIDNRESRHTPADHLNSFYRNFDEIRERNFDGMIITGAPLGLVSFEDVHYWDSVLEIIRWSRLHVSSTLFLCWAAQAGLKALYDLPKRTRESKLSGIYEHLTLVPNDPLVRGFDDSFFAPHSRYADFPVEFVEANTDLRVLAASEVAGGYLMASADRRQVYLTGHPEYDSMTLAQEYHRDVLAGLDPALPEHYFPGDDPEQTPRNRWRSHGNLLFSNWLNYYVYQITPYDLSVMETKIDD